MDYMQDEQDREFDYVVVGAGFSGAYCAGQLAQRGFRVAIVDKARGTGGRLSSKRLSLDDQSLGCQTIGFDLGAHSFEVTNAQFAAYLASRDDAVFVERKREAEEGEEEGRVGRAYAVPRNSSFARGALGGAVTYFGQRVLEARFECGAWRLILESGEVKSLLRATHCVLATPPKQAAQILGEQHSLYSLLDAVEHEAQWVAMFAMNGHSEVVSALRHLVKQDTLQSRIIRDIAFEHDKQGRSALEALNVIVIHAQPDWTEEHLDLSSESIAGLLLQELSSLLEKTAQELSEITLAKHVHRWLYARPKTAYRLAGDYLSSEADNLLICGDYFTVNSEYGVESAFLSAYALVGKEAE